MFNVFPNCILGFVIEVLWLGWSLSVLSWLVALVAVAAFQVSFEVGNFGIDGFSNCASAVSELLIESVSDVGDGGLKEAGLGSTVTIAGCEDLNSGSLETFLLA